MSIQAKKPFGQRKGIAAGGHWIVDHVKVVDSWPDQDMISLILDEKHGNGGCAYNLLKDLSKLCPGLTLCALGLLGDDADGKYILEDCRASGIDCSNLKIMSGASTSYADVMTVQQTGRRTFFHHRGTNALLNVEHFDLESSNARIFHLGYLGLLNALDQERSDNRNGYQVLLSKAKALGMITSADIASHHNSRLSSIITPCLPDLDYLFLNEIEALQLTEEMIPHKGDAVDFELLEEMARAVLAGGVREAVIIHMRDGAVAVHRNGLTVTQTACLVPVDFLKGAAGAGDAFAAGFLFGIHEGWKIEPCLELATCSAAVSLGEVTCSNALRPWQRCLDIGRKWGFGTLKMKLCHAKNT